MNFLELKQIYNLHKLMGENYHINAYVLLSQYLILTEGIIIPKKYYHHNLSVFFKMIKTPVVNSMVRIFNGYNEKNLQSIIRPIEGLLLSDMESIQLQGQNTKKIIKISFLNDKKPLSYYFPDQREDVLLTIPQKHESSVSFNQLSNYSENFFNFSLLNKEIINPKPIENKPIMLSEIIFDINKYCLSGKWSLASTLTNRLKFFQKNGIIIPDNSFRKIKCLGMNNDIKITNKPNGVFEFLEIQDQVVYFSHNIILNNLYRSILGNPYFSYKILKKELKHIENMSLKAERIPERIFSFIQQKENS